MRARKAGGFTANSSAQSTWQDPGPRIVGATYPWSSQEQRASCKTIGLENVHAEWIWSPEPKALASGYPAHFPRAPGWGNIYLYTNYYNQSPGIRGREPRIVEDMLREGGRADEAPQHIGGAFPTASPPPEGILMVEGAGEEPGKRTQWGGSVVLTVAPPRDRIDGWERRRRSQINARGRPSFR